LTSSTNSSVLNLGITLALGTSCQNSQNPKLSSAPKTITHREIERAERTKNLRENHETEETSEKKE